jgi:nucleoside permease NupC
MGSQTGKKSLVLNAFVEMCAFNNTLANIAEQKEIVLTAAIGGLQAVATSLPGSGAILMTSLRDSMR